MTKLIVALDLEKRETLKLINELTPEIEIFKIGHLLFTQAGEEIFAYAKKRKTKIFLDLKYHDIPSVVGLAVKEVCKKYQPFALTLHTLGGKKMLEEAVKAITHHPSPIRPLLFGVTVLTSISDKDLKELGFKRRLKEQVKYLASLAKKSGLDGVVASAEEIELVKKTCGKDFLVVVPGIRPANYPSTDQERILTPREAIKKGADYLVIGRPITRAKNPEKAVKEIIKLF